MSQKSISILLIGGEYRLQDGLRALVSSLPQKPSVRIEKCAGDAIAAIVKIWPQLVIINSDLLDLSSFDFLKEIKSLDKNIPCIILVDTLEDITLAHQAGADSAILRGFSSNEFFGVLNKMISEISNEPAP